MTTFLNAATPTTRFPGLKSQSSTLTTVSIAYKSFMAVNTFSVLRNRMEPFGPQTASPSRSLLMSLSTRPVLGAGCAHPAVARPAGPGAIVIICSLPAPRPPSPVVYDSLQVLANSAFYFVSAGTLKRSLIYPFY